MRTVYPVGTTLYQPDECWNGYTLIWAALRVRLIDMNGRTVNEWQVDSATTAEGVARARLLENGRVLVQRGGMMSQVGVIQEYDWDGRLAWQYAPEGKVPHGNLLGPHHDVFRKPDGNTLLICREAVPQKYLRRVREQCFQNQTLYGDAILEVDPAGHVVWDWHCHEHLDLNHYRIVASPSWRPGPHNSTVCDWTHVNTVQALPANKWHDAGDVRFRPGNVMISPRNLDTVYIIDRASGEIAWSYRGDYFGGLSGQHEPHMIEKHLPGEGNILIFDNGASPWKDLGHAGASYVLEVNPVTNELVWVYDKWLHFYATYTSSAQRLGNGNTFVCESVTGRLFEVTPGGQTVWEHVAPTPRSYRYPYDHCPQAASLGRPRELPVTPPKELRIPPDEPPDGVTPRGLELFGAEDGK
ncbi:MAG TPA: arylsulfotransferase family protein [Phycisphaerae bacterium]|nr:arylsulfotransferase family protein [Phycisphaerae bacterium]